MADETKIELFRGDTWPIRLAFTNDDVPANITGWTIYFTVREKGTLPSLTGTSTDTAAVIKKSWVETSTPLTGVTSITLSTTDTNIAPGSYVYDVQIKNVAGEILTIVSGEFRVKPDTTRSS